MKYRFKHIYDNWYLIPDVVEKTFVEDIGKYPPYKFSTLWGQYQVDSPEYYTVENPEWIF